MNLNDIRDDETVVVDANILLYAIQKESQQCKRLLLRCADGDLTCIVPMHILAEVMHVLIISEARDNGWITGGNPAKQLASKPELIKRLIRYETLMRDLLAVGFQLEPLMKEDFISAMTIQKQFGLLTNDALFVAVGQRFRTKAIVSADKVFSEVLGVMVYMPDDMSI